MSPKLGITLSHPHLEHVGIDVQEALQTTFECKFSHIRLGSYWNRIEKSPGNYDFTELESILESCEKIGQKVFLTVGVKAPRWPEFYYPNWVEHKNTTHPSTQENILHFIEKTITTIKKYTCITHWQVENEPLDQSGPDKEKIGLDFLRKEIKLIKQLDSRPIILNMWGNGFLTQNTLKIAGELADVVALDIYYKQFVTQILGRSCYIGPRHNEQSFKQLLSSCTKPVWIAELQAEPWEKDEATYLSENPTSISPEKLRENIAKASVLPVEEILLWGFEYWLLRAKQGDHAYLDLMKNYL